MWTIKYNEDSKLNGKQILYWYKDKIKTPNIAVINNYINGRRRGWCSWYFPDGQIQAKINYINKTERYEEHYRCGLTTKKYYI